MSQMKWSYPVSSKPSWSHPVLRIRSLESGGVKWQHHNPCEDVGKWSKGLQGQKREVWEAPSPFLPRSRLLVLGTLVLTSPRAIRITSFCSADSTKKLAQSSFSLQKLYKLPTSVIVGTDLIDNPFPLLYLYPHSWWFTHLSHQQPPSCCSTPAGGAMGAHEKRPLSLCSPSITSTPSTAKTSKLSRNSYLAQGWRKLRSC